MVEIYATLIIRHRKTFDQVPEKLKADVEARLKELGYGTSGEPLTAE